MTLDRDPSTVLFLSRLAYEAADYRRTMDADDEPNEFDALGWKLEREAHDADELATAPAYEGKQVFG